MKTRPVLIAILLLSLLGSLNHAAAQGTAFTYQGELSDSGGPLNGSYDLTFTLYDGSGALALQVGSPQALSAVPVNAGLFTVALDFGGAVFTGPARWLGIAVHPHAGGATTILSPRQQLTPTPYAIYAESAGSASTVANASVSPPQLNTLGAPTSGEVLSFNGTNLFWTSLNSAGGLTIPYSGTQNNPGSLFTLNNTETGPAATFLGNVGIGTATPNTKLEIKADIDNEVLRFGYSGVDYHSFSAGYHGSNPPLDYLGFNVEYSSSDIRRVMTLLGNGNVGIGTTSPGYTLDVNGSANCTSAQITAGSPTLEFFSPGNEAFQLKQEGTSLGGASKFSVIEAANGIRYLLSILWNGNVGIGTTNPLSPLDVRGETRTCVLTITGGCDLAEPFEMSGKDIPKGAVVIIDEDSPGQLKLSGRAYDKRVAGIVSGANGIKPGISLHQQGALDGGENVALSGRVYALADASNGPIKPGDLLTTSAIAGHCMKVLDHAQAQGAVIGKAMSSLETGKGMVLVLVSLQ